MPPPRLFIDRQLRADDELVLPAGPARHVQVLRLQPGAALTLFDGNGGEWAATVVRMGRSDVAVRLGLHTDVERELALQVTLALGMPANERMDALVEKATELGVGVVQPLMCERAVLRLAGERAEKKVTHWQAVALAACEQSGRTRVPQIAPVRMLGQWLQALPPALPAAGTVRWLLSPDGARPGARPQADHQPRDGRRPARPFAALELPTVHAVCLSGPEGGLTPEEEAAALAAGFDAVSLGPRVLRADTAPLALLAYLGLCAGGSVDAPGR